jgi:prolyl-tRNA synthetase
MLPTLNSQKQYVKQQDHQPSEEINTVDTPNQHSIEEICQFFNINAAQTVKTLIVHGCNEEHNKTPPLIALVLRGDHELNEIKAEKLVGVAKPLTFATDNEIQQTIGCNTGSIGPKGLSIPVIVDRSAYALANFVCGANIDGQHLTGVNWDRDCMNNDTATKHSHFSIEDIRNVQEGDASPDGQGKLVIKRGIEVGHIFQLGTQYSEALKATALNENGKAITMSMGCYGIGVSRIVAAAIEQNYDDRGIIWPQAIAPFQIAIIPMNLHKSPRVAEFSEKLYQQLNTAGYDVFYDDRKERPGVKFADAELIGIPHRIVIGEKGLDANTLEYKGRTDKNHQDIAIDQLSDFLAQKIATCHP